MPKRKSVPRYRKHKPAGQAVVTMGGRDFCLGPYNSRTSIDEYDRLIAEWLAAGRRLPGSEHESFTVNELIAAYWDQHVDGHYRKNGEPTSEQDRIRWALRIVRRLYGRSEARDFGPLALKACRQKMIEAEWARETINGQVGRTRRMFKWAVANELIPADVYQALLAVQGLQKGCTEAVEPDPVEPVSDAAVEAIRPYVSRHVWAMIELQRLSGMRPGEVCLMRTCDLDTGGRVWIYTPESRTGHSGRYPVVRFLEQGE